jgi:RNA polymerase sigma-70 factor (ECF subfamily)
MSIFRRKAELLSRFRRGDRDALEEVYRAYVDKVSKIVRFGFRLPQGGAVVPGLGWRADEVADIVQEVFARSFSHSARASYDGERDYAPYLYAVARNVLADRARRVGRELPMAWSELLRVREEDLAANEEESAWADAATVAAVRAYVEGLEDSLKQVHEVRYVQGLSQREAAEKLGISRQTLRTLEGRLRDGLRQRLKCS